MSVHLQKHVNHKQSLLNPAVHKKYCHSDTITWLPDLFITNRIAPLQGSCEVNEGKSVMKIHIGLIKTFKVRTQPNC